MQFDREYSRAYQSGLIGDFATARALVSETEVVGMHCDILDALPELARTLPEEGREVSFMNLTNVGDYITQPGKELFDNQTGLRVLLRLARELPLAENAVIVESSLHLLSPSVHIAQPFIDEWALPVPAMA
jgi:hypothetical protein